VIRSHNPGENEPKRDDAVDKMFQKFPPKAEG